MKIQDLPQYAKLELLDCELSRVYIRRDELSGVIDEYMHPYEIVISFPKEILAGKEV